MNFVFRFFLFACCFATLPVRADESYVVETVTFPSDMPPEIGAVDFDSEGTLYVALRRGDIVTAKPGKDPGAFEWQPFASGFHNACGIHIVKPGHIIISQMAELTEVIDTDKDGVADEYLALATDFGLSGNYHETMDVCPDGNGGLYLAPGTASHNGPTFETPRGEYSEAGRLGRNFSSVQWRGWVLHWTRDGGLKPVASGYRMHNGIERGPNGGIWCGDNQGDWRSASPVYHVTEDSFAGHPSSLIWDTRFAGIDNPLHLPRVLLDDLWNKPAFQLPRFQMNSCAEPAFDTTGGKFGPFEGQMLIPDQSGNRIVRCMPEMVDGAYQGASAMFIEGNGLERGNNRLAFSPSGDSLYVGQTGRGWGKLSEGLQRIRYTGAIPFDVKSCSLTQDGFVLTFTKPPSVIGEIKIERYRYEYGYRYGGDPLEKAALTIESQDVDSSEIRLSLSPEDLLPNYIYDIKIEADNGEQTYNGTIVYTLNRLRRPEVKNRVTIEPAGEERFRVEIDGELFTEYLYDGFSNPILFPIRNQSGTEVTRDWPIREDGRKNEQNDHPHHKSLFIGHQGINGTDFWHEGEKDGRIEHARTIEARSGKDRGLVRTFNLWKDAKGDVLCTDTRELKFSVINGASAIDLELNMHASHGDIVFGEFKDGFVGLRTHPHLRLSAAADKGVPEVFGYAETSTGSAGKEVWGENADWIHYWGKIEGKDAGIAILAHPENPRSPTWWHARDYGLIAANPFGPIKNGGGGELTLPNGETLTLRYRFLFHDKTQEAALIADQFSSYANEPLFPRTVMVPIPTGEGIAEVIVPKDVIPRGDVIESASRTINGKKAKAPVIKTHGFVEGAPVFGDRDFQFSKLPEYLRGGDLVITYNDDKKARDAGYEITISEPGTLILLMDKRIDGEVAWLKKKEGKLVFERRNDEVRTNSDFTYRVYAAEVDPGTYTLGHQSGGSFYSIVAINRD